MLWHKNGLGDVPTRVSQATLEYRQKSDVIGQFLREMTIAESGAGVKASDLYATYTTWCSEYGEDAQSQVAFGRELTVRGIAKKRIARGFNYEGIRVRKVHKLAV